MQQIDALRTAVAPTNWRAEQAIRPAVVNRKNWGGNRTPHGAQAGDDSVQWSLRFGLIVLDDGVLRRALRLVATHRPWPDVDRKLRHAVKSMDLAGRFVATGDEDGALVQVRTALSLAARARLLSEGTFPLSRAELPA